MIQDVNIFLNIEQFIKKFTELQIINLMNMQSKYDQIELNKESCDLTDFMMMLDLLRNCTFIQSETNSVVQFCWAMIQILENLILNVCHMFLNNITVKESQFNYNNKKSLSEVHQYILKTIQNLNSVLINVKCIDECVLKEKSQYIIKQLQIINYIYKLKRCSSEAVKTLKPVDWSLCNNIEDAYVFIDFCVYYWLWIKNFVLIAASIYDLFKKNRIYQWSNEQQKIINKLKIMLSTQSVIWLLSYDENTENIILTVNFSLKEWNLCFMQIVKNKKWQHVCKYDNKIWSVTESVYNTEKWECCNLLKFLKKVQTYLYKVFFIIELDTQTLVTQLNCDAADVFDAFINY